MLRYLTRYMLLGLAVALPVGLAAQATYVPLAPLPGGTVAATLPGFLQALINISLGVGGILAVLMLVIGGFQWMVSEAIDQKSLGRERVKNAILGLLILLASFLIINTINPRLLSLDFLNRLPEAGSAKLPVQVEEKRNIEGVLGCRGDNNTEAGQKCIADIKKYCDERSQVATITFNTIDPRGIWSCVAKENAPKPEPKISELPDAYKKLPPEEEQLKQSPNSYLSVIEVTQKDGTKAFVTRYFRDRDACDRTAETRARNLCDVIASCTQATAGTCTPNSP